MVDTAPVTVYAFHIADAHPEESRIAPYKATRAVIERQYRAQVIEGTAEQVDPAELDADGHFRRLPTGWGAFS